MSVTDVDAERVFRCAFRLEQVAEDVRTAAARTARCFPDDWRGDAGIAYQQRLDATADRVRRMSVAYDAASAVLMPYARAVLEAQEMWRRSESLLAEADAAGPGAGDGLRTAAYRTQADAAELEQRAAMLCAASLDDEAQRAPATSGWRSADRFLGDVARFGVDTVAGTASLAGMAWHALPGVGSRHSRHEARDDLVEAGKAAASVWNIPLEIRDALDDDRPGLAAAAIAGVIGPGRLAKLERGHIRNLRLATDEAFREADIRALKQAHVISRPTYVELSQGAFSVLNEEARGGHAYLEHIGASEEYLRFRNGVGRREASSFVDVISAERLVNQVLRECELDLPCVYDLAPTDKLVLNSRFDEVTGYYTQAGSTATLPAYGVRVIVTLEGGKPHVRSAYPTP